MGTLAYTNVGSDNDIAVGYLLAQHKLQLGDKYVPKITLFKKDDADADTATNMLFCRCICTKCM
jgi:hypothetical protein